jgi:hypothetical protein
MTAARARREGRTSARRRLACAALVGAAACSDGVTGVPTPLTDGLAVPALLRLGEQEAPVVAPDTVRAGAAFTVAVASFGGGCVRGALDPVVRTADGAIEITLRNHTTGGAACPDDLRTIEHRVTLQATPADAAAGRLVLRLVGGASTAASGWQTVPLTVTRTVVVR